MSTRIDWLLAGVMGLGIIGHAAPAAACSCAVSTPEEAFDAADFVFSGTVTGVDRTSWPLGCTRTMSSEDPVYVTMDVMEVWKGQVGAETVVVTATSGASCGYDFEAYPAHLVYAREVDGEWQVSLCSGTSPLDQANEALDSLGPGSPPSASLSTGRGRVARAALHPAAPVGLLLAWLGGRSAWRRRRERVRRS